MKFKYIQHFLKTNLVIQIDLLPLLFLEKYVSERDYVQYLQENIICDVLEEYYLRKML